WPETVVSDVVLKVCIRELRHTLGDNARNPHFIETVRGRGYRFIGSVTAAPQPTLPQDASQRLAQLQSPEFVGVRLDAVHGPIVGREVDIYVSATLDVFLRAEVTIFLAALGVSLVGIIIGIALRTRAFLYAGTSFLVLNIVGQLILLFSEQRLTRAIVLLTLGTLITGSMIWFNIQREAILQRLRIFRADLAMWA